jgi:hypothetical protein
MHEGTTYRVDVRDRALTEAETARVAEEARASGRPRKERNESFWLREPWARRVVLATAGVVLWRQSGPLAFGMLALVAVEIVVTIRSERRRARQKLARSTGPMRGPWEAPPEGWSVRETHVVARSVVRAERGDEALGFWTWLLFEIPDGAWFYLRLPESFRLDRAQSLAYTDVVLTRLWPHGPPLDIVASGEKVPIVGAQEYPPDDAPRGDADRRWEPATRWTDELGRLRYEDDGLVPERELPRWMLESVGRDIDS